MPIAANLTQLPIATQVHLVSASAALLLGPLALWLPKRTPGHRAAGYGWVLVMLAAAISSLFIHDFRLPNVGGYTPIHGFTAAAFIGIGLGLWHISRRNIARHQRVMRITYASVVVAGLFSLMPTRFLGGLVLMQVAGLG